MLLATQCPNCRTTFKVAHDQLKLQAGLVRCGVCHDVFNGIEHLTNGIPSVSPETAPESLQAAVTAPVKIIAAVEPEPIYAVDVKEPFLDEPMALEVGVNVEAEFDAAVDAPPAFSINEEFSPHPFETKFAADIETLPQADLEREFEPILTTATTAPYIDALMLDEPAVSRMTAQEAETEPGSDVEPVELTNLGFIRQARNRQRINWLLRAATALLALTLTVQGIIQFRDLLAAAYPQTKPALTALCAVLRCQVRLPAQLDAISYEADELHTLARPSTFEFSLLLRNHSSLPQAWPNIELTMKDSHKQPVVRRVFTPADYLGNSRNFANDLANGFAAGQEQQVKLYFVVDQVPVTDYLVALFYP